MTPIEGIILIVVLAAAVGFIIKKRNKAKKQTPKPTLPISDKPRPDPNQP